ncbi:hypothetical protein BGX34_007131, partial [Mortierella sp. NVP85]
GTPAKSTPAKATPGKPPAKSTSAKAIPGKAPAKTFSANGTPAKGTPPKLHLKRLLQRPPQESVTKGKAEEEMQVQDRRRMEETGAGLDK